MESARDVTLDLTTLHFASAASRGAYVIVFLVMALSQPGQLHIWYWMGAMAASMAGSLVMMQVPSEAMPPLPIATVTHGLYGGSIALAWSGLRNFFGRPVRTGWALALTGLAALIFPAARTLDLTDRVSLSAVLACCLVLTLLTAYETVRRSPGTERLWSQYLELVAFGIFALVFTLTIGVLLGTDRPIASAESARVSMVMDQVVGVFVYFGFVAMTAERANRTLARQAETDPLTSLYNRRGLQKRLRRNSSRAGRRPGGVLIADIDHFKAINDTHGHDGGDLILAAFTARMRETFRITDIIARWGGEEFLVVLPGIAQQDLIALAEHFRVSVAEQAFTVPAGSLAVTVSIGVALIGPDDPDLGETIQRADRALYDAKNGGRNRVVCAPAAPAVRPNLVQAGGLLADRRAA